MPQTAVNHDLSHAEATLLKLLEWSDPRRPVAMEMARRELPLFRRELEKLQDRYGGNLPETWDFTSLLDFIELLGGIAKFLKHVKALALAR